MLEQQKLGKMILCELTANELDVRQFRVLCKAYINGREPIYHDTPIVRLNPPKKCKVSVELENGSALNYRLVVNELKIVLSKYYVE